MKLFFETASHASSFLSAVPLGLLMCLFLCSAHSSGMWRLLLDLGALVCSALVFFFLFVICRNDSLRFYHLLGVLTGAILCLRGIGVIAQMLSGCFRNQTNRKLRQESGKEKTN